MKKTKNEGEIINDESELSNLLLFNIKYNRKN